jgi:hypothetical protein
MKSANKRRGIPAAMILAGGINGRATEEGAARRWSESGQNRTNPATAHSHVCRDCGCDVECSGSGEDSYGRLSMGCFDGLCDPCQSAGIEARQS